MWMDSTDWLACRYQGSRDVDVESVEEESGEGFREDGYAAGHVLSGLLRYLPHARR